MTDRPWNEFLADLRAGRLSDAEVARLREIGLSPDDPSAVEEAPERLMLKSVIHAFRRPAFRIRQGSFAVPPGTRWSPELPTYRAGLEQAAKSVVRIDLAGHPDYTAWASGVVVGPDLLATNRHVAQIFVDDTSIEPSITTDDEPGPDSTFVPLDEIVYYDERSEVDLALLAFDSLALGAPSIPIDPELPDDDAIAVIGFPMLGDDDRTPASTLTRIFDDLYGVKRLSPGLLLDASDDAITHDASTLSGSSGSAIVHIASGAMIALHSGSDWGIVNRGVPAWWIEEVSGG